MAVGAFVVITTVGTEEQANLIASELVARRHASCVNVVTGVRSVYRWQGKICRDAEFLLIVKTLESEYPAVQAAIQELHSYELPEILAFKVCKGESELPRLDRRLSRQERPRSPTRTRARVSSTKPNY